MIDVLYLCHGRLAFTKASLPTLIENTDWGLVRQFVVYNDAAPDHPATFDYLNGMQREYGFTLRETNLQSPVGVMNHYLARATSPFFAKIDNDIVVPPNWLNVLMGVMEHDPDLELLGMEPCMSGITPEECHPSTDHSYIPSSHIGGVGLMRRSAFTTRPRLVADGRFGFTEWQHEHRPVRGWVQPDIRQFALDQIPEEPWQTLTREYVKKGLNREWPPYSEEMSWCWEWWQA